MGAQFAGQELTSAQGKRYAGDQQGQETRVQEATKKIKILRVIFKIINV